MLATQASSGREVNRMMHINQTSGDLLSKLEAVRLLCKHSGCAQRYLTHDAHMRSARRRTASMPTRVPTITRFRPYMHQIQDEDLTLGIAMTDAKGDRSSAAPAANPETYVRIVERR